MIRNRLKLKFYDQLVIKQRGVQRAVHLVLASGLETRSCVNTALSLSFSS